MKFRRLLACGLAATLALSGGVAYGSGGQARADDAGGAGVNVSRSVAGSKGRVENPPILPLPRFDLRLEPNQGYLIRFENSALAAWSPLYLLAVNGTALKEQTVDDVKKMILSPAASEVKLELLTSDVSSLFLTFQRTSPSEVDCRSVAPMDSSFSCDLDSIDKAGGKFWGSNSDGNNLDIICKANFNLLYRKIRQIPDVSRYTLSAWALQLALNCYRIGDFRAGDNYLDLFAQNLVDGKQFPLLPNATSLSTALKRLLAVDRSECASKLLKANLEGVKTGTEFLRKIEMVKALKLLLLNKQLKSAYSFAEITERLKELTIAPGIFLAGEREWLASYFKTNAKVEEAIGLYKLLVNERSQELHNLRYPKHVSLAEAATAKHLWRVQPLAYDYYQLALLQKIAGDVDGAEQSLLEVLNLYKNSFDNKQRNLLERLPQYFPRTSDINLALVKIHKGESPPDSPVISQSEESGVLGVLPFIATMAPARPAVYEKVRACYECITEGKKDLALKTIDELLTEYQLSIPHERRVKEQQNLVCSVLSLARALADHGWFDSSSLVLKKLDVSLGQKEACSPARVLILSELACNAEFAGEKNSQIWHELERNYHLQKRSLKEVGNFRDFAWHERLRKLAVAYYYAGESARAEVVVKKALASMAAAGKSNFDCKAMVSNEGFEGERILLYLDVACIAARLKKFAEADGYISDVLERKALWNEAYGAKFSELADLYSAAGMNVQAESFLRRASGKEYLMSESLLKHWPHLAGEPEGSRAAIDFALVRLLVADGRLDDARPFCDEALKVSKGGASRNLLVFAARLAEAAKDYAAAAKYYYRASGSSIFDSLLPQEEEEAFVCNYLTRAADLCDKARSFNLQVHIEILMAILRRPSLFSRNDNYKYCKRAYQLMPDFDVRKVGVGSILAKMERLGLHGNSASGAVSSNTGAHSATPIAVGLAPDVMNLLWGSGLSEADLRRLPQLIANARDGIQQYHREYCFPIFANDQFISRLIKEGYLQEAEDLLKEAVAKVKEVSGAQSKEAYAQLVILLRFYAEQRMRVKTLEVLDEILGIDPNSEPIPSSSIWKSHCACSGYCDFGEVLERLRYVALSLIEGEVGGLGVNCGSRVGIWGAGQTLPELKNRIVSPEGQELGLQILHRLLARQKAMLKPDDERLELAYISLGDAYGALGNYKLARENYEIALKIAKLYMSEEKAYRRLGRSYIQVLRMLGDDEEIKRVEGIK